ncbi:MAG TPA: zinc metallopeptidase [Verrucomicrobiae bacterium]|nr:zinc metallopeptidase [Verrucomicrobiae bacterium]
MFFNPFYYPYWWFAIPGLLLGLYAQFRLSADYRRYSEVPIESGLSGAEAAREILDRNGLNNIAIEAISGHLTDHFDPLRKALFLSEENYSGRSIAAVGVSAHEAGHALQQKAAYPLFNFRMWLAPATQFASYAYMGIFFLGWILGSAMFAKFLLIGIGLFAIITLFQIITLPVEYDASRRAKQQLISLGLVQPSESAAVSRMLYSAGLTYVAAMLSAVLQLLRLIMIYNRTERR